MSYFLKKTQRKYGLYLQIYETVYNHETKSSSNRCFKSLGNVESLVSDEIKDPIAYYKEYINELNMKLKLEKESNKIKKIDESPEKYLGHFIAKAIFDKLDVEEYFTYLQSSRNFQFSVYNLFTSLVYSRLVLPCSKYKTYTEVLPKLFKTNNKKFSIDQLYDGLDFIGNEYEKVIEILNKSLEKVYKTNTETTYFDCTNFYFEIDKEDNFRRKGPSKENRKDPIVGIGLLLDANQIPLGMKMYPGNQSEQPVLREIISSLKSKNNIKGRTIQVADKGLNSARNIYEALINKDGYLFSKSVKKLPDIEKTWVLLDNDYSVVYNEYGEPLYKTKSFVDHYEYSYTHDKKKVKFKSREKRIVTYNFSLARKQRAEINRMVDKARILARSKAKKSEFGESAKYISFQSEDKNGKLTDDKIVHTLNEDAINKDLELAGYNLIVTSEYKMKDEEIYSTYRNLWKIEESFRIMKGQLDTRPVYLQKESTINAHFLVCYTSILMLRLIQYQLLDNEVCASKISEFMHKFRVVEDSNRNYINLLTKDEIVDIIAKRFNIPIDNFYLTKTALKKVLNLTIKH